MSEVFLTDASFQSEVMDYKGVVLVDFFATWCGPCKMLGPVIEELAKENEGKAKISKIDVDENPLTAGQFGVQSIPTIILFKDGKEIDRMIGFQPKTGWQEKIDKAVAG
jgi:thioredoxin 1